MRRVICVAVVVVVVVVIPECESDCARNQAASLLSWTVGWVEGVGECYLGRRGRQPKSTHRGYLAPAQTLQEQQIRGQRDKCDGTEKRQRATDTHAQCHRHPCCCCWYACSEACEPTKPS
ncbi:hypothetical protein BGZ61DRAFT_437623 [Ilyonectria robusta]|uniref:uncharacterized protein n=1 Tax=Ilyonectria robusta TaxID=1079257 RepID=UPI001E8DCADF|nr:uncharacterized protein BGZ61DRAFT_437623 [Ilyonectria robusta]KAH8737091.1 hypothetical protein BGZ61DRAFT_437623 [Ilyonectria robusta]